MRDKITDAILAVCGLAVCAFVALYAWSDGQRALAAMFAVVVLVMLWAFLRPYRSP